MNATYHFPTPTPQQSLDEALNRHAKAYDAPEPEDAMPYTEMDLDAAYSIFAEMAFGRSRVIRRDREWALKVIDAIRERI